MASNIQYNDRQQFEIQLVQAQIARVEQKIAELELECQMTEMTLGTINEIDEEARIKIEVHSGVLNMLRADLAAREHAFAQSLIQIRW